MKRVIYRAKVDGKRFGLGNYHGEDGIPATRILREWRNVCYWGLAGVPCADEQPDFPDLAGETLDYRQMQSLASRFPGLTFIREDEVKKPGDGKAPTQQADGGAAASKDKPAEKPKPLVQIKASLKPGGGHSGKRRSIIWRPFPTPKKADVAKASRLLTAMYEEAVESAREVAPIRWSPSRLAVYGRAGQPDRARVWEEQGLPRLLLAIDNSGSIGGQIDNLRAFGAAVAEAVPWLLVMAAPNGVPMPLAVKGEGDRFLVEIDAILDGKNWTPPGVRPGGQWDGWNYVRWADVLKAANVVAAVYVGDYEDDFLAELPAGMRRGTISIQYCAQMRAAEMASGAYARERAWPAVVGMDGSIERSLAALELLLAAWKRG